jgi:hypothetical protein
MSHLVIVGGSDAGISAALRAKDALLHEKSYPWVGFSPFSPHMRGSKHRPLLLSLRFLATEGWLFIVGRL